jgi:hypothetical protein
VNWCAQTGQGMQHMGSTVMRTQAEAAETARMSMPAPVPYDPSVYQNRINATSNPVEWVQILGDAREQAARHDAAHAEAIRVIETYSTSLLSTNGTMPAFTPPPEFGNGDTKPGPDVPAPGGGAGGSPGSGGSPPIAPNSGGGPVPGSGSVPASPIPSGDPVPASPVPSGAGSVPASPVPGGPVPGGAGPLPASVPPASTPVQVASPVPGTPDPSVPTGHGVGSGATGVPDFLPSAGIGEVGAGGHGSSAGRSAGGFGPRGSSAMNALGRGGLGSTGEPESATGAGRGVAGMAAGRGLGVGGAVPPVVGGGQGRGKEDTEHRRPSYLIETEDIWGDGRRVVPPVIGADSPESSH